MSLATDALAIARAGIRAVDPQEAVRSQLACRARTLRIGGRSIALARSGKIRLVALGKAAGRMADAANRACGGRSDGLAVTSSGSPAAGGRIETLFGEHPVPGSGSFVAGRRLREYVGAVPAGDAILFLVSGGGSSLAEVPGAGVTSDDLARTTERILASGAPIGAANTIRRHLSALKGGALASAVAPGVRFATLAISDVAGDRPCDIASGPTATDPTTFAEARAAVEAYRLARVVPRRVLMRLDRGCRGQLPETVKPGPGPVGTAPFVIAASNPHAVRAAASEARRRGYAVRIEPRLIVGSTEAASGRFARALRALSRSRPERPRALVGGGETTVVLGPRPGRGGRNQEFALRAASALARMPGTLILSMGTDGIDGPTDAAGGWVDSGTLTRAKARRLDVGAVLRRHDAYPALDRLGSLIRIGPTGTNVMDLHVGLSAPVRPAADAYGSG